MMSFDHFKVTVNLMVESSKDLRTACDLGIDLIDFAENYNTTISMLWSSILTSEGVDWLEWFLYEKDYLKDGVGDPEMQAFSKTDNDEQVEIVKDLEGLYEYLVENNYFKCESQK